MARRLFASICAVVLAAFPKLGFGETPGQQEPEARMEDHRAVALERWSIRAFLRRTERRRPVRIFRPTPSTPRVHRWHGGTYAQYSDATSPLSRLRSLRNWRLATLWRGRDSSLVLGLVDDAYFGFRLEAEEPAGTPRP